MPTAELIQTKFSVITGGPSVGKSSLIDELKKRGIPCLPEAGSICIETRLQAGEILKEVCAPHNQEVLQRSILDKSLELEGGVSPMKRHVLDRSAADAMGYCKLYGHERQYFLDRLRFRYDHVFLLERLPFKPNHVRIEDEKTAGLLHEYIAEGYEELGYDVIRVPVMEIRDRADFVLRHIENS